MVTTDHYILLAPNEYVQPWLNAGVCKRNLVREQWTIQKTRMGNESLESKARKHEAKEMAKRRKHEAKARKHETKA